MVSRRALSNLRVREISEKMRSVHCQEVAVSSGPGEVAVWVEDDSTRMFSEFESNQLA